MPIIGIDLGTSHSPAALLRGGRPIIIPSPGDSGTGQAGAKSLSRARGATPNIAMSSFGGPERGGFSRRIRKIKYTRQA